LLCFFMVELIMSFPGSILIFSLISQVWKSCLNSRTKNQHFSDNF
jgi:hypothetical protein